MHELFETQNENNQYEEYSDLELQALGDALEYYTNHEGEITKVIQERETSE